MTDRQIFEDENTLYLEVDTDDGWLTVITVDEGEQMYHHMPREVALAMADAVIKFYRGDA